MKASKFVGAALSLSVLTMATDAHAAIITVTGGNATTLQTALTSGSTDGDIIEIGDNLTYNFNTPSLQDTPITNRTLRAAPGFTPAITGDTTARGIPIFTVKGSAATPAAVSGIKFNYGNTGATRNLIQYLTVVASTGDQSTVSISHNDFRLDNLDSAGDGRGVYIAGVRGPSMVLDGNLFAYDSATSGLARQSVRTDGGTGGFIARNNVLDSALRAAGNIIGFNLGNEGGANSTNLINNTILFNTAATATAILLGSPNPLVNGVIENNIIAGADIAFDDQNAGVSSYSLSYNDLFNVGTVSTDAGGNNVATQTFNITSDPMLGSDPLIGPLYVPQTGSPVINAGNLARTTYGLDDFYIGNVPRIMGGGIEIGAVEVPEPASAAFLAATGAFMLVKRRRSIG